MKQITTPNAPQAEHILSQGIVSGGHIFVAGQIHQRPEGSIVEGSVKDKLDQIISNVRATLEAGGSDLAKVVKVVIYVTDMGQMPELNEIYASYFTAPLPAREAICVAALPLGATIELSVVAEA